MITLCIFGYLIIIGVIMTDRGNELNYVLKELKNKLETPYNIETEITIHKDKTITISASKRTGLSIQHASVHSNNLIDALWQLIKYIEQEISVWLNQDYY